MSFSEFCMLFLACAILALVRVLASILQEHRLESAARNVDAADRARRSALPNATPVRHSAPDRRANGSHVRVPEGPAGLGVRFRSPVLASAQSLADALRSSLPILGTRPSTSAGGPSSFRASLPAAATGSATSRSSLPAVAGAGSSTSRPSLPTAAAGPATSRSSLPAATAAGSSTSRSSLLATVAGPSTSRASLLATVAGPSMSRASIPVTAAGPSTSRSFLATPGTGPSGPSIGASVPWSPKKGWTSTCRVNGITYHRTEKRMRPRKSLKVGSEEPELVITPYWEPENVAAHLIEYPPDLSGNLDLAVGDLFIFHTPTHYRLWIYRAGGHWQRIEAGYQREDGRFLIVTPVKKEPSWVSREYFERQINRQADSDSD